jgi:hypothetical protein
MARHRATAGHPCEAELIRLRTARGTALEAAEGLRGEPYWIQMEDATRIAQQLVEMRLYGRTLTTRERAGKKRVPKPIKWEAPC